MEKYGLTTELVHAERRQNLENGAVHKAIYTSSQYTYEDANDLVAVFQGRPAFLMRPRYAYYSEPEESSTKWKGAMVPVPCYRYGCFNIDFLYLITSW